MPQTSSGHHLTKGWPRAAGLFGVVLSMSVLRPGVLIAIPLLVLFGMRGVRGGAAFAVALLAMLITISGPRDGIWFMERAWALVVAGWFVALTMARPTWRLSSRAMAAVLGSIAAGFAFSMARTGAWDALDWTISYGVLGSMSAAMDLATLLMQGRSVSPALVTAMYEMAEAQAAVFPALIGLATMAALAVAWWVFTWVTGGGDQGIGPVGMFRFNDHLVWLLIGGLLLVVTRWGDVMARVGANAVVFMGALYALRGAGVVMFVSGGISLLGYVLLALGLMFASPVVVGVAILIGIGDTWLDLRARVDGTTA